VCSYGACGECVWRDKRGDWSFYGACGGSERCNADHAHQDFTDNLNASASDDISSGVVLVQRVMLVLTSAIAHDQSHDPMLTSCETYPSQTARWGAPSGVQRRTRRACARRRHRPERASPPLSGHQWRGVIRSRWGCRAERLRA
jgi:hypothetical protein